MSRKKNPTSLNIGKNNNWVSCWHIHWTEYFKLFQEDVIINSYIRSQFKYLEANNILFIKICRIYKSIVIDFNVSTLRFLNKELLSHFIHSISFFFNKKIYITLNKLSFIESYKSGFNIALKIARFIEQRVRFRSKTIKTLLKKVRGYSQGVYVQCTGRINNVDMARVDKLYLGSLPIQSISSSISYGLVVANTSKGLQSIKVWICK